MTFVKFTNTRVSYDGIRVGGHGVTISKTAAARLPHRFVEVFLDQGSNAIMLLPAEAKAPGNYTLKQSNSKWINLKLPEGMPKGRYLHSPGTDNVYVYRGEEE